MFSAENLQLVAMKEVRVGEGTQGDRMVVLLRTESLPPGKRPGRCWAWCSLVGAAQDRGCPGNAQAL